MRSNAQSAVINLNIFNRSATLEPFDANTELLFSANVGDVSTVSYTESLSEQVFIGLSNNPDMTTDNDWVMNASADVPTSYVVDVTDGTFTADLISADVPRFDLVSSNSIVTAILPASAFQLAVDSSDSTLSLGVPTNAQIQSAQLITNGGLMTLSVENNVSFISNISVISGGLTIEVPMMTGVQLIVESTVNSEITLPDSPRIVAENIIYTTPNFDQSTNQVLLNVTLNGAAIRIIQDNTP